MSSVATTATASTRTMPAELVNTCPGCTSCLRQRRNASVTEPSATPRATFMGSSRSDHPLDGVLGLLEAESGVLAVELDRVDQLAVGLERADLVEPRPGDA